MVLREPLDGNQKLENEDENMFHVHVLCIVCNQYLSIPLVFWLNLLIHEIHYFYIKYFINGSATYIIKLS